MLYDSRSCQASFLSRFTWDQVGPNHSRIPELVIKKRNHLFWGILGITAIWSSPTKRWLPLWLAVPLAQRFFLWAISYPQGNHWMVEVGAVKRIEQLQNYLSKKTSQVPSMTQKHVLSCFIMFSCVETGKNISSGKILTMEVQPPATKGRSQSVGLVKFPVSDIGGVQANKIWKTLNMSDVPIDQQKPTLILSDWSKAGKY